MSGVSLSLDQAPPLSVPARFFITAPLFGLAAAVTLFLTGPAALASRWTPVLLGITHLLVLGFITMAMIGALLQLLPVLAATPMKKPEWISASLHTLLSTGAVLLAAGLAGRYQWPVQMALLVLGAGFLLFIVIVLTTLRRSPSTHASIKAMRLAALALAITVTFGVILGTGHGWPNIALVRQYTDLHLVWGLLGWVGLLSIGLAYQVVPMFQMTPEYPLLMQRGLILLLLLLLLLWSWGQIGWPMHPVLSWITDTLLAAGFTCFGIWTLYLLGRRRRRVPDVTLWFWRLGMSNLLACVLLWAGIQFIDPVDHLPQYPLVLGVLMIIGFAISIINGMLYKILPFLIWLHLQTRARDRESRRSIPNVKKIISHERALWQLRAHMLALLLLLAAVWWPQSRVIYVAAGCFALSCLMLWANLLGGLRTYRSCLVQMTLGSE